jgi:adenylylsulfate kinase-like enzyme
MIYFITGRAGAGKTTLAKKISSKINAVLLDGDDFRETFPMGFSEVEREAHILHMAKIAALLERQGRDVIIAAIMPKRIWREAARSLCEKTLLIYLPGGKMWDEKEPHFIEYEEPTEQELQFN